LTEARIEALTGPDPGDLRADLVRLVPGPLRACGQTVTAHTRAEYWLEEIRADLRADGAVLLLARSRGHVSGLALLADLVWESRVLRRRMRGLRQLAAAGEPEERARVLDRLVEEAVRRAEGEDRADCLVHRCQADDAPAIHALERRGFLLMDTLVDYVVNLEKPDSSLTVPLPPAGTTLRPAAASDLEGLLAVARSAFEEHPGRFHSDERIPHAGAVRVYEEWIRSCLEGWADRIVVADCRGSIAGYSAWKKPSELERRLGIELGHYSIGAVSPEHAASGLFRALTAEGMHYLSLHARLAEGPTHAANVPVQRAYASLGWRAAGARHGFHRWSKS